jgi:MtN3 and saliva related transmembrane protein
MHAIDLLGLIAGAITSLGFIPQLAQGYKTKKLNDVSYYMLFTLAVGMTLWLLYGIVVEKFPIIVANGFGICCCLTLVIMKRIYSLSASMKSDMYKEKNTGGKR